MSVDVLIIKPFEPLLMHSRNFCTFCSEQVKIAIGMNLRLVCCIEEVSGLHVVFLLQVCFFCLSLAAESRSTDTEVANSLSSKKDGMICQSVLMCRSLTN